MKKRNLNTMAKLIHALLQEDPDLADAVHTLAQDPPAIRHSKRPRYRGLHETQCRTCGAGAYWRCITSNGKPLVWPHVSRRGVNWRKIFAQACPTCEAPSGHRCVSPSGREEVVPHANRIRAAGIR